MSAYEIGLIVVAIALLGTAVLPRLLEHRPLSFPIVYVGLGVLLFAVVPGAPALDPIENSHLTERITELVVIVSLMGAGLKLDRHSLSWRRSSGRSSDSSFSRRYSCTESAPAR